MSLRSVEKADRGRAENWQIVRARSIKGVSGHFVALASVQVRCFQCNGCWPQKDLEKGCQADMFQLADGRFDRARAILVDILACEIRLKVGRMSLYPGTRQELSNISVSFEYYSLSLTLRWVMMLKDTP